MGIIDNELEGVLLTGLFDRSSKNLEQEVDAFVEQLASLQKQLGFAEYVRAVEEEGDKVKISVIPVSATPTKVEQDARAKGAEVVKADADGVEAARGKYDKLMGKSRAQVDVVPVEGKDELKTGVLGILSKKNK